MFGDARNYKSHFTDEIVDCVSLKETEVCCLHSVGQDEDGFPFSV